ncbi:MAG: hypothetical protein ABIJ00_14705 [Candidatus Eisenbacteria bacterium]
MRGCHRLFRYGHVGCCIGADRPVDRSSLKMKVRAAWRTVLALGLMLSPLVSPTPAVADSGGPVSEGFLIPQGETYVTQTTDLETGYSSVDTTLVTYVEEDGRPYYLVKRTGGGMTTSIWMSRDGLLPYRYQSLDSSGSVERQIDFSGQTLRITGEGEGQARIVEVEADADTHTGATLLHHLRAFSHQSNSDKVDLRLLVDRGQDTFRIVDVYAKRRGQADVVVPGGTFRCVEIEFGVAGMIGRLFWSTRYHYYYTADPPCHLVKYVDPGRKHIELIQYGRVEKTRTVGGD